MPAERYSITTVRVGLSCARQTCTSPASGAAPRLTCGLWASPSSLTLPPQRQHRDDPPLQRNELVHFFTSPDFVAPIVALRRLGHLGVRCVGCGRGNPDVSILRYNGMNWSTMSTGMLVSLSSVWGTSRSDVWAVGSAINSTAGAIVHYNGTSWSRVSGLTQAFEHVWALQRQTCGRWG